jgi:hypothetical protein
MHCEDPGGARDYLVTCTMLGERTASSRGIAEGKEPIHNLYRRDAKKKVESSEQRGWRGDKTVGFHMARHMARATLPLRIINAFAGFSGAPHWSDRCHRYSRSLSTCRGLLPISSTLSRSAPRQSSTGDITSPHMTSPDAPQLRAHAVRQIRADLAKITPGNRTYRCEVELQLGTSHLRGFSVLDTLAAACAKIEIITQHSPVPIT